MEDKLESIAILLSTYNGEKFLEEQIESIISQTYINWDLYIRDDGSTDSTIEIIERYCKQDSRIKLIKDTQIHRGPKNSFLWLLEQVEADYYMFCDQDDIWDSQKISLSYQTIKEYSSDSPLLAVTDLVLVDQSLNILRPSMWTAHKIYNLVHYKDGLLIASMFPGCTMFFNKKVRDLAIQETFDFPMHDIQISFVTKHNNGFILPINTPLIKYRQHSQNVIGLYSGSNIVVHKLKRIRKTIKDNLQYYSIVNKYFKISALRYILLKAHHLIGII